MPEASLAQPAPRTDPYEPPKATAEVLAPPEAKPARALATTLWVSTSYFAEGLPYMIVRWLSGVYATSIGLPEQAIGALNLLGMPWNFKFLWAPLVDWIGTKRGWLVKTQLVIAILAGIVAVLAGLGPQALAEGATKISWEQMATVFDPHTGLSHQTIVIGILVMLGLLAFASATNDITIDAYYLVGLPDRTDQAAYSGLRVTAYRVAVLLAKLGLIGYSSWAYGFGIGALVMLALAAWHAVALPKFEQPSTKAREPFLRHLWRAFLSFLDQPRIVVVLLFIICYKLGDELLFAMNSTFLLRELKVTMPQFKFLSTWIAMPTAIAGTMFGSWLIQKYTLKKMIWPLTLAMSLNIWAYVWLAWAKPDPTTASGLYSIWAIHGYEQIAAGLGNAALIVFLLYTCKPEFKAAHYAIGSAIMSLGGTFLGGLSGVLVASIGYTNLFMLAFVCSLPALALIPFVPMEKPAGK